MSSTAVVSLAGFESVAVFVDIFALIEAVQSAVFPVDSMLIAEHVQPSRNVLANSIYATAVDDGQGMAPLATQGVIVQYGIEYGFVVSAAQSAESQQYSSFG